MEIQYWTPQDFGGPEPFVERCGRVSHRSDAKITDDSHREFLRRVALRDRDHSILEHAPFRVTVVQDARSGDEVADLFDEHLELMQQNPFLRVLELPNPHHFQYLVSARHAVEYVEAGLPSNNITARTLVGVTERFFPTLLAGAGCSIAARDVVFAEWAHNLDSSVHPDLQVATYFVRGISRVTEVQDVRHRMRSYTVMSGRGVDFRDQEFIHPPSVSSNVEAHLKSIFLVDKVRAHYEYLRGAGISRQDARYYLPMGMATEMVVTASLSVWRKYFDLRRAPPAQWEIQDEARLIEADLEGRVKAARDA